MDCGVPAARDADKVAVDTREASAGKRFDVNRGNALAAVSGDKHRTCQNANALIACMNRKRASDVLLIAGIDDGADRNVRALEGQRRCIGAVVVGDHDGTDPGFHGIAVDIGTRCAGEQGARKIVVGVGNASLVRAAREHNRAGANLPGPLSR